MLGTAFTVKAPAGDNLMFNRAIDLALPGDVLVVDGGASLERALCGEIMISHAKYRGLAGFVINGCVRDIDAIASIDFPVFAIGNNPNGPLKNGLGEINVPVVAGGMAILPGDILIGDIDGVVVVRPRDAIEVAAKAVKQNEGERKLLESIAAGTWDRSSFAAVLAEKGCEII
jgi:RraA family protein